ncbi:MAG: hypothetical protein RI975_1164, partial [Pseudomonadota bacterium]
MHKYSALIIGVLWFGFGGGWGS